MSMTVTRILLVVSSLVLLPACPSVGGSGDDDDQPDAAPTAQYTLTGSYAASGTWDVSGPFNDIDGIGGVVADVLIEKVVGAAGVPAALEDEAIDWVSERVRLPIRDFVNGQLPETLRPGGETMAELAALFAQVQTTSTFTLGDTGQSSFTGTQAYTSFAMSHEGQTRTVTVAELLDDTAATSIAATTAGTRQGLVLQVEPRPVQVRFGRLVSIAGEDLLQLDIDALTAQAAAIDCSGVVDTLTSGSPSYDITVGGQTFSVGASTIADACTSLAQAMANKVLGLFSVDAPLELGGQVLARDSDGDLAIDGLSAAPGYGGEIIVDPKPLSPQVTETFDATLE